MFLHRRNVVIEWGDCDPAGIVFYPRYFAMFDASTAFLFGAALRMTNFEMQRQFGIIGFPMVETSAKFIAPSRYDDMIVIESQVTEFRNSSFDIAHNVYRPGNVLAIAARETRVWAARHPDDPDRIKGITIPAEIRAALSREE